MLLPAPEPPYRLYLPAWCLKRHAADSAILMRVGAAANAMVALYRLNPKDPLASAAARRDAVQIGLMLTGYLYEFGKTLGQSNGAGWELAERGIGERILVHGVPWTLRSVRDQFAEGSALMTIAPTFRDRFGFHWDRKALFPWILGFPDEKWLPVIVQDDAGMMEVVFEAPQMALVDHFAAETVEAAMALVSQLAPLSPYIANAVINGFILKTGCNAQIRRVRWPQG